MSFFAIYSINFMNNHSLWLQTLSRHLRYTVDTATPMLYKLKLTHLWLMEHLRYTCDVCLANVIENFSHCSLFCRRGGLPARCAQELNVILQKWFPLNTPQELNSSPKIMIRSEHPTRTKRYSPKVMIPFEHPTILSPWFFSFALSQCLGCKRNDNL